MKLSLENVCLKYPDFSIKDVSFEISSGEILALVGSNASGKTTILNLISGITKAKSGKILIDDLPLKKSKAKVAVVFQNPDSQIIFNNVYDDLSFTLKNFGVPKQDWNKIVDNILEKVDMKSHKHSEIFNMSAGQKQRIVIANMLSIDADIYIFDESSSYLDTNFKEKFYNILLDLKRQGKIVLFASNVLDEISFADRVLILSNGEVKVDKSAKEIILNYEILEDFGLYVPLKIKLMRELKVDSGFDKDIFDAVRKLK